MELIERIEAFRSDRKRTGFFLDFDGTLSRVVPDPDAARPLPGVPEVLEGLSTTYAEVAIISGRRAIDLRQRVGISSPRYVGLYGAEELSDGTLRQPDEAQSWRSSAQRLADQATELIYHEGLVGCEVELKDLAVSVHYRKATPPVPPEILLDWVKAETQRVGFHFGIGRMVIELRPVGISKAGSLERLFLRLQLSHAFVAGDDTADVEAMARAKEIVPGQLLRVGMRSVEEPEGLIEHSDLQIESGEQLVELLSRFI